ncbi:hypothetical protein BDF19DRAFT_453480 [Syncephalis fuscata]|nr:hypothetical protein BDF19DRAFT_453480 [Syncephalis fuscata]
MRVRLELVTPLPTLRCWYEIPTHGGRGQEILSIAQLEQHIKREFKIEKHHSLRLDLDGFQLLPNGRVGGLIRDNDILCISINEDTNDANTTGTLSKSSNKSAKRKSIPSSSSSETSESSSSDESDVSKTKHMKVQPKKQLVKSKQKAVVSSTSDSSSDTSEDSESDKDSSSSSESSPAEIPIRKVPVDTTADTLNLSKLIPPGQGSTATKRRNMRRLLAKRRKFEATLAEQGQEMNGKGLEVNKEKDEDLEQAKVQQTVVESVKQHSLPVKNKPKHFTKKMNGAVRTHMRFDAPKLETASMSMDDETDLNTVRDTATPSKLIVTAVQFHGSQQCQDWWEYRTEPILENNFAPNTTLQSSQTKQAVLPDTAVKATVQKQDYSTMPALHALPVVGQLLAFKQLEMSETYTPEISDYKEATVLAYDPTTDKVTLKLSADSIPTPAPPKDKEDEEDEEERPRRRFEMELNDDEYIMEGQQIESVITIDRNTMLETRLVST